ncbi:hypothetical protein OU426_07535 [Frigidibacter sp. RF13]|uniref:hypothetical protein n=1 Tax=Frigidibacter sp. RF13 TaxID=2997340 RepID=UPI00226EB816|nr:hypothetical protein [Frigidibacter sp. RF13]MCY1126699.1 hypothetical protein [Frigidibacter sp. RF13]
MELLESRIAKGIWHGLVKAGAAPGIEIWWGEERLADLSVEAATGAAGHWRLIAPIPAAAIEEGVQVFQVIDRASGVRLGHFAISAGTPDGTDLVAEIALLRADLDLLARAFRQHCREG